MTLRQWKRIQYIIRVDVLPFSYIRNNIITACLPGNQREEKRERERYIVVVRIDRVYACLPIIFFSRFVFSKFKYEYTRTSIFDGFVVGREWEHANNNNYFVFFFFFVRNWPRLSVFRRYRKKKKKIKGWMVYLLDNSFKFERNNNRPAIVW